jgi:adenine C2-methylase RlmN of 23S rRNA A2503 and tRNA A37
MLAFQNLLRERRVNTHIRRSRGRAIAAACGQLARQDRLAHAPVGLTIDGH